MTMIVTIDGPAGAGKSSAARALAARLGYRFLDTGAMYRAVAYAAMQRGIDLNDAAAVGRLAEEVEIDVDERRVLLNGEDVTEVIRRADVTAAIRFAADNPAVRRRLVELQRAAAEVAGDLVTEGRDQGTVVFPQAGCKVFLTASPEERARRRQRDMRRRGEEMPLDEVLGRQSERDLRDQSRAVGPLVKAEDAVELITDGLSLEEVVDRLEAFVRQAACRAPSGVK